MVRNRVSHGKKFRAAVAHFPYGTDQSSSNSFNQPKPIRKTVTVGTVSEDSLHKTTFAQIGLVGGVIAPQTGTITVNSNVFTALAEVILGDYRLLAGSDFAIGALADNTANNLAAAINTLPGFSATANLADVLVEYHDGSAADVEFRAMHYGSVENFIMAPANGMMTKGSPQVVAPTIS